MALSSQTETGDLPEFNGEFFGSLFTGAVIEHYRKSCLKSITQLSKDFGPGIDFVRYLKLYHNWLITILII